MTFTDILDVLPSFKEHKMISKKIFGLTTILAIILMASSPVFAVDLTVGSDTGTVDATLAVDVTVSDPTGIAGAAFTLIYNTVALDVTVSSIFFDTFANQGISAEEIAKVTETQPLVTNTVSGTGMRIAAARALAETVSTNTVLFSLDVALNSGAAAGAYPISIDQTVIDNTAAGYSDTGDPIPYLVGAIAGEQDLTLAFPVIDVVDRNGGTVTFEAVAPPDTDEDGIDDNWEDTHFGNLIMATATSDYDEDGYSDKQEYINGSPYDPKVQDAKDGDGYNEETDNRVGGSETVTMNLLAGWNLISLPVTPDDSSLSSLFPDATVAYGFDGAYASAIALEPGLGYWVKVTTGGAYDITGEPFMQFTKTLTAGWHLLGAVNGTVTPVTTPADSISVMYGFSTAYSSTTELVTGEGYWVKVLNSCDFSAE